jgi:predicted  nucleic acid-binding Zn-ribbon protein
VDGADWLRTQLTSFGCASCGRAYEPGRIRVLAEREGLFFVDLGCGVCGTRAVAVVTLEVEEDGTRPDLGELHVPALGAGIAAADAEPVDADDVLGMHEFLARFDGDFAALFERATPPGPDVE